MTQPTIPWYNDHSSIRFRLTKLGSKLTKGRIKSPDYRGWAAFHAVEDQQKGDSEQIGTDERVRIRALWTTEFYTPDNVSGLCSTLEKLRPFGHFTPDQHPKEWLQRQRGSVGSWMNLRLANPGVQTLGSGFCCPMPSFAKYATGELHSVTPSLTLLTMCFIFDEEPSRMLDEQLHLRAKTRITQKSDQWISISRPVLEHRRIAREAREAWLQEATDWHRDNFPGLFSSRGELVSGCELSTISGATPLSTDARGSKLLCALGLHWSFSIYDAPAVDKNPFVLSYPSDSNGPREMIHLTATEADFSAQNADSYGSGDNARLAKLDSQLRSTFSALALPRVLNFYARRAGEARDHAAAIIGNKSPTKALARVRKDAAQCIDASVVARELRNYMKNGWVRLHVASLQRRASRGQKKTNLCENIKDTIENSADELLANVESLHSSLNSQANLLSAHANLKLQSWIMCLALFSLLAAALAAIEPATRLYRGEYFQDKQGQQKAPVQTKTSTKPPSVSPARQPPIEAPSPAEATPRTTPAR